MVSFDNILDIFPEIFPREEDSNLARYTDAHQDEAEQFGVELDKVRESHYIDKATGEDLDRIGAMFGPLGDRANRSDQEYRIYLKSIVNAYKGAGTVPGIVSAVAAGTGVPEDNVSVNEHYKDIEYSIVVKDWPAHQGSTIEELAELADASVSELRKTRYKLPPEELATADYVDIKEGQAISDSLSATDSVAINPNNPTVSENVSATDSNGNFTRTSGRAEWNGKRVEWDFFEWAHLVELFRELSDTSTSTDSVSVNSNKTTVSDSSSSTDTVNYTTDTVYWGDNWENAKWAVEHN